MSNQLRHRGKASHRKNAVKEEEESGSSKQQNNANFPISLGKPSLRRRLEAYYSLIAPEVIDNESEWKKKFELIYDKYGGSEQGEQTLSRKLMKKYGDVVRLRLATQKSAGISKANKRPRPHARQGGDIRSEEWYQVTPSQQNSGIIDFTSEHFDPVASISAPTAQVIQANPFVKDAPLLDNTSKFLSYLPPCDPLYRAPRIMGPKKHAIIGTCSSASATITSSMSNKIPVFTSMASKYENSGPLSLLHSIHVKRDRIKVSVRYVDCMRGTLTGYLIAFDKHMNMILRDVDEVYTSRVTMIFGNGRRENYEKDFASDSNEMQLTHSKAELEWERRVAIISSSYGNPKNVQDKKNGILHGQSDKIDHDMGRIKVGKRHMHQMLVRGDNVVSVWRANGERSKG